MHSQSETSTSEGRQQLTGSALRFNQVHPTLNRRDNSDLVEIRPNRSLRIYHSGGKRIGSDQNVLHSESAARGGNELPVKTHADNPPVQNRTSDDNRKDLPVNTTPSCLQKKSGSSYDHNTAQQTSIEEPQETEPKQAGRITTASGIRCHMPSVPNSSNVHKDIIGKSIGNGDSGKQTENDSIGMFLLHGVGGSIEIWDLQISFFEKLNYEIVAMDIIGHGLSSRPPRMEAYTFKEISEDILAVFDKFRRDQNVVIGHSYGCCFSTLLARHRPRFISKLVLISGGSPIPLKPGWDFKCLPLCLLTCCYRTVRNLFLRRSFYTGGHEDATYNSAFSIPSHVLKYTMNGQDWLEGDVDFHNWIMKPTLLIHGKHDRLVSLKEVNLMRQTMPVSRLVIVNDAGHMVTIENADEVNHLIYDFLKSKENNATEPELLHIHDESQILI